MTPAWKDAYEAGIFTEFMEQRAPGHTVLGDVIYRKGLLDLQADIGRRHCHAWMTSTIQRPTAKRDELRADGDRRRRGDPLRRAPRRKGRGNGRHRSQPRAAARNSGRIAEVCRHVPAHAPSNFWEALQAYWFIHLGVVTELNTWDSFNPGHFDQHLYPFYRKGWKKARSPANRPGSCWNASGLKFNNQPAPPKVGVTAAESGTYTDFANINTGGLKRDGSDGRQRRHVPRSST